MNACTLVMQSQITSLQVKVRESRAVEENRGIIQLIILLLLSQCGKSIHCVLYWIQQGCNKLICEWESLL